MFRTMTRTGTAVEPARSRISLWPSAPRRLGKGWQYVVYDLGNGRVRKTPRSFLSLYPVIALSPKDVRPLGRGSAAREVRYLMVQAREATRGLETRLDRVDAGLFGNPVFHSGGAYEQDKVAPFGAYLDRLAPGAQEQALLSYVRLQQECWRFGLADPGFDFAVNAGVDRSGRVVQIDLGELRTDRAIIAESIARKVWLIQDSFKRRAGNGDFCSRFEALMGRHITHDALEALWPEAL